MTIEKLTDAAKVKLETLLIRPKYRTLLTEKEKNQNALLLQQDIEKDRPHTPKHKTQLVAGGIGLYSAAIAARVYARLAKTSRGIGCYHDHQTLCSMTQDIIPRFLSMAWTDTILGRDRKETTKRVACKKCPPCLNKIRKGLNPNRAECTNIQTIERPAQRGLPAARTLKEWIHGLLVECCSWSYCENRGYLASDERLTHADWELVYRHAPKKQSLGSLGEIAQAFVENDRISGVLLSAWLDDKIDERTEAIIMMKATERGKNTHDNRKGKHLKLGLKRLHEGLNHLGINSTRAQTKTSLKNIAEIMTTAGYDKKGNNWSGGYDENDLEPRENKDSWKNRPTWFSQRKNLRANAASGKTNALPTVATTGANAIRSTNGGNRLSSEDRGAKGLQASTRSLPKMTTNRLVELLASISEVGVPVAGGLRYGPRVNPLNIDNPRKAKGLKAATLAMLADMKRAKEAERMETVSKEFEEGIGKLTIGALLPRLPKFKKATPAMSDATRKYLGLPSRDAMKRFAKFKAESLARMEALAIEKGIDIYAAYKEA